MQRRAALLLAIPCVLWCALVTAGFAFVAHEGAVAGDGAEAPVRWPPQLAGPLLRSALHPTILVAVHPECPCSRATATELEQMMRGRADKADVHILFVHPHGLPGEPERSALWARMAAIPGARLHVDDGGRLAGLFGAHTSGQVLVYDRAGVLRFAGGITGARGHEGANAGRAAIESLLDEGRAPPGAPVFGCSLLGEKS